MCQDIMSDTETLQQPNKEDISLFYKETGSGNGRKVTSMLCSMPIGICLFLKIFLMWSIIRSFLNLLTVLVCLFFFLMFLMF